MTSPRSSFTFDQLANSKNRVLVITAHPDDSEFYPGGTLARLKQYRVPITLLIVTNGDKGYYPFEDSAKLATVRQKEQLAVAQQWGAKGVIFMGRSDGRFEPTDDLVAAIESHIRVIKPTIVMTFDPDYPFRVAHGDHRKAGDAAVQAVDHVGGITKLLFATLAPNFTVDVSDTFEEKLNLLAGHRSQFDTDRLDRVRGMLESAAENGGRAIGTEYGESFRVIR